MVGVRARSGLPPLAAAAAATLSAAHLAACRAPCRWRRRRARSASRPRARSSGCCGFCVRGARGERARAKAAIGHGRRQLARGDPHAAACKGTHPNTASRLYASRNFWAAASVTVGRRSTSCAAAIRPPSRAAAIATCFSRVCVFGAAHMQTQQLWIAIARRAALLSVWWRRRRRRRRAWRAHRTPLYRRRKQTLYSERGGRQTWRGGNTTVRVCGAAEKKAPRRAARAERLPRGVARGGARSRALPTFFRPGTCFGDPRGDRAGTRTRKHHLRARNRAPKRTFNGA